MRRKVGGVLGLCLLVGLAWVWAQYGGRPGLAYPEGYRGWTHVKSMILEPGHPLYEAFGGLHHIYANAKAMEGYRSSPMRFPDGAVIVFDLLEVIREGNAIAEGPRKLIGVMVKDRRAYPDTDGWGYYAFGPDKKPLAIDPLACHGCHRAAQDSDFVYSRFRP